MAGTGCHSLLSPASPLSPEFFSRRRAPAAASKVRPQIRCCAKDEDSKGCADTSKRKVVWFLIFQHLGLNVLAPETPVARFFGWWRKTIRAIPKELKKGLNSLIILVAWEIWKHRNGCVFENLRPDTQVVLKAVYTEGSLWCMAGASKLQELVARLSPPGV